MSTPGASSSKKRGQYVSRACNECRRRRCKCDGVQPTCGTCTFSGRECSWSAENDARRPATKQLVDTLHAKIQALETELAQLKAKQGIPLTESTSIPDSPLNKRAMLLFENPEPTPTTPTQATVMYRYIFDIDVTIPVNEQSKDARLSLVCDWNRHLPSIPGFERFEHDMILSRFFKYSASWLYCMIPETFLHDMLLSLTSEPSTSEEQAQLQHYSPILHCAIMAYASAFSDDPNIRAQPVRAQFAQHAKQWLDPEFENPNTSLVRALALLAEYRASVGEREAGYMYMGMSFCVARSFVPDTNPDEWQNESTSTSSRTVNKEWHFWSAFSQDKMMALEYRQEYDIPVPRLGVSLPCIDVESDNLPWSDGDAGFPPRLTTKVFFETCKLMVISSKIIEYLHNRNQDVASERAVINIHLQLDTWFNNLPRELLVWARSTSPLPHMIVLHICYWYLIICLHQPMYGLAGSESSSTGASETTSGADSQVEGAVGTTPIHDLSIKMSDRATHKIVQLLQMFESQHNIAFFPTSMMHAVQQCGIALLREAASVPASATKKRSNALAGANTCMRVLKGIATSWPWATQLAEDLGARLRESGVNVASPSYNLIAPTQLSKGDASAMDISPSMFQFVHVWEAIAPDNSVPTEAIQGLGLNTGIAGPSTQGNPSGIALHATASSSRAMLRSLTPGGSVGVHSGMSTGIKSMGTPSASSTSSYSVGGDRMSDGMWDPPLFE